MSSRKANVVRTTDHTEVRVAFCLDGHGRAVAETGVPMLDHALALLAHHGSFDLEVKCTSDGAPSSSVAEDVGYCLGLALDKALGAREGIPGLSHCYAPADDHLARAVVWISGSPNLVYRVCARACGPETVELEGFWRSFAGQARVNLHIELLYGECGLPALEAVCKAAGFALRDACSR